MKKQKLNLKKLSVSSFATVKTSNTTKGGTSGGGTGYEFCSVNLCQTIDYTACYGERYCQIYDTNNCGGGGF